MTRRNNNSGSERILVFRIGSLGDILIAVPSFWRIRAAFPSAEITLLSGTSPDNPQMVAAREILPKNGLFDGYMTFPNGAPTLPALKMLFEIRSRGYERLIYLMPRTRSMAAIRRDRLAFRLAGIRQLVGAGSLVKNALSVNATFPAKLVSRESDFLWDLLTAEGVPGADWPRRNDIAILPEERKSAEAFIRNSLNDTISDKVLIGIAPGGKWSSKIWPDDRFAAVLASLKRRFPIVPVIVGDRFDFEIGERILAEVGGGINAAGKLNIRGSAAVLQMCRLYLGNDTGAMHLAAAVGTPCVAIFAAIDWPGRWYPAGNGHSVLRKQVECEGCHLPVCPYENRCLRLIETDEVIRECLRLLGDSAITGNRETT